MTQRSLLCLLIVVLATLLRAQGPVGIFENHSDVGTVLHPGSATFDSSKQTYTLTGSGDAAAKKALDHNLPTAGLAIFDFAIDDWNAVAFRRGKLVRFTSPKLLKLTSDD